MATQSSKLGKKAAIGRLAIEACGLSSGRFNPSTRSLTAYILNQWWSRSCRVKDWRLAFTCISQLSPTIWKVGRSMCKQEKKKKSEIQVLNITSYQSHPYSLQRELIVQLWGNLHEYVGIRIIIILNYSHTKLLTFQCFFNSALPFPHWSIIAITHFIHFL